MTQDHRPDLGLTAVDRLGHEHGAAATTATSTAPRATPTG